MRAGRLARRAPAKCDDSSESGSRTQNCPNFENNHPHPALLRRGDRDARRLRRRDAVHLWRFCGGRADWMLQFLILLITVLRSLR